MKYMRLVLVNLVRNRRRTLLTTFAFGISLFTFAVLMSLPGIAESILKDRVGSLRLFCHSKAGMLYSLPPAYRRQIETIPHVEAVSAFVFFGGIYHLPIDQFPNAAVDHEQLEKIWSDWGISSSVAADFRKLRTACLVGPGLMRRFNWHLGQQIALHGTVYPVNLTLQIVGELGDKAPPPILLFRRDYLDEITNHHAQINMYFVKVDGSESISEVQLTIDRMFANSAAETQTDTELAFFSNNLANFRAIFTLAYALSVVVTIVIGLIATNTAAMAIRERRTEMAVMRALGFDRLTILALLLAEGAVMGIVGGILGCVGAYAVLRYASIGTAALGPLGLAVRLPGAVAVETLVLAAAIGLVSVLVPSVGALRRDIVETIRHVA
jgi:putative ABC transport system permease protein